jgi:hypothetical protein
MRRRGGAVTSRTSAHKRPCLPFYDVRMHGLRLLGLLCTPSRLARRPGRPHDPHGCRLCHQLPGASTTSARSNSTFSCRQACFLVLRDASIHTARHKTPLNITSVDVEASRGRCRHQLACRLGARACRHRRKLSLAALRRIVEA